MLFGMFRDAVQVSLYFGHKPLLGMTLPGVFTFCMLWGVWFNNVRRAELNPAYNKLQGSGSDGGH